MIVYAFLWTIQVVRLFLNDTIVQKNYDQLYLSE